MHSWHAPIIDWNMHICWKRGSLEMMKISPMPLGTWIPPWNNQNGGFLSPIIPTIEVKSSVYLHANLCCHAPCFTHIHHSKLQSSYPKFNFHPWSMCAVSARLQCLLNQLHLDSDSKSQKSFDGDYLSSLWKIIYIWPHQPLFPILHVSREKNAFHLAIFCLTSIKRGFIRYWIPYTNIIDNLQWALADKSINLSSKEHQTVEYLSNNIST